MKHDFTASELEFLRLLSHGVDADEAARHLKLRGGSAPRLIRLKRRLDAVTTAHLVATALRHGLID
jgi:DNA-binding CsgD family transcriptional regulator